MTIRQPVRGALFRFVRRIFATDDGRLIAAAALNGLLPAGPPFVPHDAMKTHRVYPELGVPRLATDPSLRADPIIITGRFRSGSTLLWNIFRQIEGCTAYYEPFNERRWFDPSRRGSHTDATHLGVSDYWREYDGLKALGGLYEDSWIDRHLYMDASAWNPAMKRYVCVLIEAARGRPVLQFNRIDLRLPWFRAHFPNATFVHLYRNPRDQWCSSLVDRAQFPKDAPSSMFAEHDHFYLLPWARDLRHHFPFIDERSVSHPYQLFYYVWKLSYLFGVKYAHYSLAFEHLVQDPAREVVALMEAVEVNDYDLTQLTRSVANQRLGKWRDYADDAWFARQEAICEAALHEYFGASLRATTDRAMRPARPKPLDRRVHGI